jgi:hypothetical protein
MVHGDQGKMMFKNFLVSITHNAISLVGTAIAVATFVLIASLFGMELWGFEGGPYLGILTYLILPMIFVFGLILIPVGAVLYRRKLRRTPEGRETPLLPVFDLNIKTTRSWMLIFLGAAHARSPHSRVACADCHIGPGADWFVKSKLDGAWQLVSVAFDLYPQPVTTPLHDLRPARETCEQCHWPTKFIGDKLRVIHHYEEDEESTELTTALLLKVGGSKANGSHGIHWHVDPDVNIRYRSDETREEVYDVEFTHGEEETITYSDRKAPEEGGVWRSMDCVDCHNRPSHIYESPGPAIDKAIEAGQIDRSLPFVKRESLRVISAEYESHDLAREAITAELTGYYAENYPDITAERADDIAAVANILGDIYSVNVFPGMNVWWDTYPNHIGHEQSDGCFRCHRRSMRAPDRQQISNDCENCHVLLAEGEEDPDIMSVLRPE